MMLVPKSTKCIKIFSRLIFVFFSLSFSLICQSQDLLNSNPVSGNVHGLVVPIEFTDASAAPFAGDLDNFFNQQGYQVNGNNGSLRDYFYDISGGALSLTHTIGPIYTAPNDSAYYKRTDVNNIPELLEGALQFYEDNGFDFSPFTLNQGNTVASLVFIHAGPSEERLGPHKSDVSFSADGVTFGSYALASAYTGKPYLTINSIAHEMGHSVMDWPDLYDSDSSGIGRYCLMSWGESSGTNPQVANPYLRARAGWLNIIDIDGSASGSYTIEANSMTSYRYRNPHDPNEFFLIEAVNNNTGGRWDALPDDGLLIWHIDENVPDNVGNRRQEMTATAHYQVSLEQADGLFELETSHTEGSFGDAYSGPGAEFTPTSVPNSNWWDGSESGLRITNISEVGPFMRFDVSTERASSSPLTCTVNDASAGGGGYGVYHASVTNSGTAAVAGWAVTVDFGEAAPSVDWSWGANVTALGTSVSATGGETIQPGESIAFGFGGRYAGAEPVFSCM